MSPAPAPAPAALEAAKAALTEVREHLREAEQWLLANDFDLALQNIRHAYALALLGAGGGEESDETKTHLCERDGHRVESRNGRRLCIKCGLYVEKPAHD